MSAPRSRAPRGAPGPSGRRAFLVGGALSALVGWGALGCASPRRAVGPADFPIHDSAEGLFRLHWRLDRGSIVGATGLVEVGPYDRIAQLTLELEGLDTGGRRVSQGVDYVRPMTFVPEPFWPFAVRLRPTGREDRFVLRVTDFSWRVLRGGS